MKKKLFAILALVLLVCSSMVIATRHTDEDKWKDEGWSDRAIADFKKGGYTFSDTDRFRLQGIDRYDIERLVYERVKPADIQIWIDQRDNQGNRLWTQSDIADAIFEAVTPQQTQRWETELGLSSQQVHNLVAIDVHDSDVTRWQSQGLTGAQISAAIEARRAAVRARRAAGDPNAPPVEDLVVTLENLAEAAEATARAATGAVPTPTAAQVAAAKTGLARFQTAAGGKVTSTTSGNIYRTENLGNGLIARIQYESVTDQTQTGVVRITDSRGRTLETSTELLNDLRAAPKGARITKNPKTLKNQITYTVGRISITIGKDALGRPFAETIQENEKGDEISRTRRTTTTIGGARTILNSRTEYDDQGRPTRTVTVVAGSNRPHSISTPDGMVVEFQNADGTYRDEPLYRIRGFTIDQLTAGFVTNLQQTASQAARDAQTATEIANNAVGTARQALQDVATARAALAKDKDNQKLKDALAAAEKDQADANKKEMDTKTDADKAKKDADKKKEDSDKAEKALDTKDEKYDDFYTRVNEDPAKHTSRSIFGAINYALTAYQGLSGYSNLFMSKEALGEWRENIDQFFAETYLGSKYWASEICANQYDREAEGVAFVRTPDTIAHAAAHIQGRISSVAVNPITGKKEYLYQVTGQVKPVSTKVVRAGVEQDVPGSGATFKIFLRPGNKNLTGDITATPRNYSHATFAGGNTLVHNSTILYNQVCIVFSDPGEIERNPLCSGIALPPEES